MLTIDDVDQAAARIAGYVRRTPMMAMDDRGSGMSWLKAEHLQQCGVFKTRGAFNRQLAAREQDALDPGVGIVCASGGNAGLANAYAAARLGVPATVFVPEAAPRAKVERLHAYGAVVHRVGAEYAEAYLAAEAHAASTGALFCHAYDQVEIAAGAGTIAREILDDLPGVSTIVVAVGGGGLLAGISVVAAARGVRVVGVEPELAPTLHRALEADEPVDVSVSGVAADSLGARRLGEIAFSAVQRARPTSVLVSDDAIVAARRALWDDYRIAAEHGAATAYAALLSGAYVPAPDERVALVICGANTDPATLAAEGRG